MYIRISAAVTCRTACAGRDAMGNSKQITYNTIGNTVTLLCQWLIMMLIPRITDFSEAGVFAVALSICSILNIFATFSLNQYQISDQYVNYGENDYRVSRLLTIGLSFVMCFAVIVFLSYSLEQCLVIIIYMVYRNLLHYAYLHTATLQIRERLDYVGKCTMLEGILSLISFTAAYYITHDLVLSAAVMAALGGGAFLLSVICGYGKTEGRGLPAAPADRAAVRSMMKMGVPLLISGVAPIVITALPKLMLQYFGGDEVVGIFSTLSAPTIVVPTLITGIFAPFIIYFSNVSRSGNMHLLRRQYCKMAAMVLGFGIVCYIAGHFLGGYFFTLLYGDDIVPYVGHFNTLVIGIILYSIGICGVTVLITKEQGRAAAAGSVAALAISVLIFALAIPEYGIDGATYGLMAAYGIFGLIISIFVLALPLSKAVRPAGSDHDSNQRSR